MMRASPSRTRAGQGEGVGPTYSSSEVSPSSTQVEVLIVGGGPVGLTLAIDLGQRRVRCLLVERNARPIHLPKMERCNARTMEIYRRLGIAERVRAAGLPADAPMDVMLAHSMAEPPLAHLRYPSVSEAQADIASHNDGTRTLEPYQVISQYTLEPLLRSIVGELPSVALRVGCELESFVEDADGVVASVGAADETTFTVEAPYLVGCDGASSTVRRQLGIRLEGSGSIRTLRQALFHCPDLYEQAPVGKARHYHIAEGPLFPFLILQDSTRHWTLHAAADSDAEMARIFEGAVGFPIAYEMLSVNQWTQHLLCAERYQSERVFIAGDAAHLMIPTGGLGMNTGIGDAVDLAWKLAATLEGWGGPGLLSAYDAERRAVGLRNVQASGRAMDGRLTWRAAYQTNLKRDPRAGHDLADLFAREQRKVTEIQGLEAGYRYVSQLIAADGAHAPDLDATNYIPGAWPGVRLPHVWLADGRAVLDCLSTDGFTLVRLRAAASAPGIQAAFKSMHVPLRVLTVDERSACDVYGHDLLLIRPDAHVAWRGDREPADPISLCKQVSGHA
jgi:2-polyprenyl-6-methoxyphenol hydroxylase-like FAD-dependent oxidoreductase